jgi:hypothetical protein
MLTKKDFDRFNKFVKTSAGMCWEWLGNKTDGGYGRFRLDGRRQLAHRLSYEAYYGPIPEDILVLHRCNNTSCVNPNHLYLGGASENMKDRVRDLNQHSAKLTENEVRGIRGALILTKIPQHTLAYMFGVSDGTISEIKHNKRWDWVKAELKPDTRIIR